MIAFGGVLMMGLVPSQEKTRELGKHSFHHVQIHQEDTYLQIKKRVLTKSSVYQYLDLGPLILRN